MPLTKKGRKIMSAMEETYGSEKGKSVFYASKNKGTISGVDRPRTAFGEGDRRRRKARRRARTAA